MAAAAAREAPNRIKPFLVTDLYSTARRRNSVVVNSSPKTGALAKTDGICGIPLNHLPEVPVDGFGVTKQLRVT